MRGLDRETKMNANYCRLRIIFWKIPLLLGNLCLVWLKFPSCCAGRDWRISETSFIDLRESRKTKMSPCARHDCEGAGDITAKR